MISELRRKYYMNIISIVSSDLYDARTTLYFMQSILSAAVNDSDLSLDDCTKVADEVQKHETNLINQGARLYR